MIWVLNSPRSRQVAFACKYMAQRRMFSKSITNSSQFLMMPQSSQNLYFHLGMNADDDGFCEHFAIMRMTESKPDDLKVLQAKGFVSIFDEKVLVILAWKENNYLRTDRYSPSKYLEVYKEEIKRLSSGIPMVDEVATQVRLGKVSIGKDRIGEDTTEQSSGDIAEIIDLFKSVNPSYSKLFGNKTQRASVARMLKTQGKEKLVKIIAILPKTNSMQYMPNITTPLQLEDKMGQLASQLQKKKNNEPIIL